MTTDYRPRPRPGHTILCIEVPLSTDDFPELVEMGIVEDDLCAYIVEEIADQKVAVVFEDIGPGEDAGGVVPLEGRIVDAIGRKVVPDA